MNCRNADAQGLLASVVFPSSCLWPITTRPKRWSLAEARITNIYVGGKDGHL
jgi:hypothetical protein